MRIACLFLPGFVLQVHVRAAPYLKETVFAVLDPHARPEVPRIVACSRAAHAQGVEAGMTVTQARVVAPGLRLVDGDPAEYAAAMAALGEALMALSVTVDITQPGAVYVLVPPSQRESEFGERMLQAAAHEGLTGRVGIADGRFTAWAATQAQPRQPVRQVAIGGGAAFLAPLSLDLLPLGDGVHREALKTLMLCGLRTMGALAALPPASIGRRFAQRGLDAQALARGEDRQGLEPYVPIEPIRETVELEDAITELEPVAFVLRPLLLRVTSRVTGRGKAAARTVIALRDRGAQVTEVIVAPARPTTSPGTLLDLARAHLAERKLTHAVRTIIVEVIEEAAAEPLMPDLFSRAGPAPGALDVALARLRAAFGQDAVFGTELRDRHRPEAAYERVPFQPEARRKGGGSRWPGPDRGALRLMDPPMTIQASELPQTIQGRRVAWATGPVRLQGEWWTEAPLGRDYYEIVTCDGGRYWVYRDHVDGRFYLHGVFD